MLNYSDSRKHKKSLSQDSNRLNGAPAHLGRVTASSNYNLSQHSRGLHQPFASISRRRCVLIVIVLLIISYFSFSPYVFFETWKSTTIIYPADENAGDWRKAQQSNKLFSEDEPELRPEVGLEEILSLSDSTPLGSKHATEPSQSISGTKDQINPSEESVLSSIIYEVPTPKSFLTPLPDFKLESSKKYENVTPATSDLSSFPPDTKFLTYLPHSGFHNQRIELLNAFKLSKLLNRTLILPEFRLGLAVSWQPSNRLTRILVREMKDWNYDCVGQKDPHRKGGSSRFECEYFKKWTSVQAQYVLEIKNILEEQPVVNRHDMRDEWLWESLSLSPGDWYAVKDLSRYSYQVYESKNIATLKRQKYEFRIDAEDLRGYDHVKLLSFGSFFGTDRIVTRSDEMKEWTEKIEKNQIINLPILESVSNQIAQLVGGKGNYIGLHLRLHNFNFEMQASSTVAEVFNKVCKDVLKLDDRTISSLLEYHREKAMKGDHESTGSDDLSGNDKQTDKSHATVDNNQKATKTKFEREKAPSRFILSRSAKKSKSNEEAALRGKTPTFKTSPKLKCPQKLHTSPNLQKLNTPIYIASDVKHPRSDSRMVLLYDTFPCIFSLDDFSELTDSSLRSLVSSRDGLKLKPFLIPMLEAIVVSKGFGAVGTPGSTFSSYAVSVLHPFYSQKLANEKKSG